MTAIIEGTDLQGVPGIVGSTGDLAYAARRASDTVSRAWCSPTAAVPAWVMDIAVDVAARYLSNLKNLQSVTYSVDDGSRTERYNTVATLDPTDPFSLTQSEADRLCPSVGAPRRRVGSIRLRVPGFTSCP